MSRLLDGRITSEQEEEDWEVAIELTLDVITGILLARVRLSVGR